MRVVYDDGDIGIDDTLLVLGRSRSFDDAGALRWTLQLASVYKQPRGLADVLYDAASRVGDLETA